MNNIYLSRCNFNLKRKVCIITAVFFYIDKHVLYSKYDKIKLSESKAHGHFGFVMLLLAIFLHYGELER